MEAHRHFKSPPSLPPKNKRMSSSSLADQPDDAPTPPSTAEETEEAIVLILVGPPGSGKSTFCNTLMASACRPWLRICQDTIANGKAGTKSQCLMAATKALQHRKSVLIDRCNLEIEQRSEFVKLGGPHVEVHALVFDLPAKLCISRSVNRVGHEGKLQGGRAAAVVNTMLQKKQLPDLLEGFSRITFCQNDGDVQSAVDTYCELGPEDTLPSGCFGKRSPDNKVQTGILKFFKKVEPLEEKCTKNLDLEVKSDTELKGMTLIEGSSVYEVSSEDMDVDRCVDGSSEARALNTGPSDGNLTDDIFTLAFPSVSTSDFQFDHERASNIIIEKVEEFLKKVSDRRLVLVDLSRDSHILSLVRTKAAAKDLNTSRFMIVSGDITKLYTENGLRCHVIANAANWRLKPGGGGVNAAIFSAAGEALESATKKRASSISPGNALSVPLPSCSPLHKQEGVTHVIHVLGPNMNPMRPNFLKDDYDKGCEILHQTYASLFEEFLLIKRIPKGTFHDNLRSLDSFKFPSDSKPAVQFLESERKVKCGDVYGSDRSKRSKRLPVKPNNEELESDPYITSGTKKRSWGSWAQALYTVAMDPGRHKNGVLEVSDNLVVLNDLYPKAKKHFLVLARTENLDQIADVRREHLPLIREMHSMAIRWAKNEISDDLSLVFRFGYHSVPSLRQLHLHVISQDFDSSHLKNKKHWNSFNTPFFLDAVNVIEELKLHGKALLNDESLLSMELRCHKCRSAHPNIPRLKAHISKCESPFPAFLQQNGRVITRASLESEPTC